MLVVGSGQTGLQLAEELFEAGRRVYISVGSAGRVPRRYRGRDIFSWIVDIIRHGASYGVSFPTADQLPGPPATASTGWIEAPILDELGYPRNARGVTTVPGLYFLGLLWQHSKASASLVGPELDRPYLADAMARQAPRRPRRTAVESERKRAA